MIVTPGTPALAFAIADSDGIRITDLCTTMPQAEELRRLYAAYGRNTTVQRVVVLVETTDNEGREAGEAPRSAGIHGNEEDGQAQGKVRGQEAGVAHVQV